MTSIKHDCWHPLASREVHVVRIINNNNVRVNPYKMLHCITCLQVLLLRLSRETQLPQIYTTAAFAVKYKLDLKLIIAANWKKWIQIWKAYEIVTGLDKQPSTLRVASFIMCIGPDALEIHAGLLFPSDDDRQNIDKVLELWQDYCIGKTNVIYERYRFNNRLQVSDESIDAYTTALRTLVVDNSLR